MDSVEAEARKREKRNTGEETAEEQVIEQVGELLGGGFCDDGRPERVQAELMGIIAVQLAGIKDLLGRLRAEVEWLRK